MIKLPPLAEPQAGQRCFMGWVNYYGLAVVVVILIPNVIFVFFNKNGFENLWHNKFVEIAEQAGRFSCFAFMIFNIPKTWFGFWFKDALIVYLVANGVLVTAYCVIWAVCFKKDCIFCALALSGLPSVMFIADGIILLSVPLTVAGAIFAPCHILLSYKNADGRK